MEREHMQLTDEQTENRERQVSGATKELDWNRIRRSLQGL